MTLTRTRATLDLQHHLNLTLLSPHPRLQPTLLVCLLRRHTMASILSCDGLSHHNLSNGNRWEASAFSLLVFLGHFGFCSSLASRFWGQEAARILAASACELVPSSSSEESPPPAGWGVSAPLWRGGGSAGKHRPQVSDQRDSRKHPPEAVKLLATGCLELCGSEDKGTA